MFAIAVGRSQKLNLSGWAFNRTLLHVTALKQRWPAKAFSAAYLPIAARSSAKKVVVYFIFLPVVAPPLRSSVSDTTWFTSFNTLVGSLVSSAVGSLLAGLK